MIQYRHPGVVQQFQVLKRTRDEAVELLYDDERTIALLLPQTKNMTVFPPGKRMLT